MPVVAWSAKETQQIKGPTRGWCGFNVISRRTRVKWHPDQVASCIWHSALTPAPALPLPCAVTQYTSTRKRTVGKLTLQNPRGPVLFDPIT